MELIPENMKINKPGKKIIAVFVGFFVISIVEIFIWPLLTFWDLTPVDPQMIHLTPVDPNWLFDPIQSPDLIFWMQQFTSFCHFDFKLINKYFINFVRFLVRNLRTVWSKLIKEIKGRSDPSHFFEIIVGNSRIWHTTTQKLNDEFLDRLKIDWRFKFSIVLFRILAF